MKLRLILTLSATGFLAACFTQKQPKVSYEFPEQMLPDVKAGYVEMWHKGQVLYNINCSGCHNQVVNRKVVIPEFTEEQLAAYEIRVADPKHEMGLSEAKVNAEELNFITIFLTYRKHDSVALKKLMAAPKDHSHDAPL